MRPTPFTFSKHPSETEKLDVIIRKAYKQALGLPISKITDKLLKQRPAQYCRRVHTNPSFKPKIEAGSHEHGEDFPLSSGAHNLSTASDMENHKSPSQYNKTILRFTATPKHVSLAPRWAQGSMSQGHLHTHAAGKNQTSLTRTPLPISA